MDRDLFGSFLEVVRSLLLTILFFGISAGCFLGVGLVLFFGPDEVWTTLLIALSIVSAVATIFLYLRFKAIIREVKRMISELRGD